MRACLPACLSYRLACLCPPSRLSVQQARLAAAPQGDYNAIGEPVWPTKFVPMKTPMSREILANWSLPEPPRHSLTIPLLLERQRERGEPIGLIIDLANHECL